MVRAAARGAFNYAKADPQDPQWQIRHLLVIREIARQDDLALLNALHSHWLAYVSHSRLEEDSWKNAKTQAANVLTRLQATTMPWDKVEKPRDKKDTIDSEYGDLIQKYRELIAGKKPSSEG